MAMDTDIVLSMRGMVKKFGNLVANDHINIELKKGEVLGILGENGAGKTTLMNVLYGLWQPDEGEIYIHGKRVHFKSPKDALNAKIGMVAQHYSLVPITTVAENITLSGIPTKRFTPLLDTKKAEKKSLELAKNLGFNIDTKAKVENLSVGEQQRVEILKALYQGAEILILDEPTAVLTTQEADELFNIVHKMADNGKSVILITHKLREAMKCDRIIVLRGGKLVFEKNVSQLTMEELRSAMFGETDVKQLCKTGVTKDEVVLDVKNLNTKDYRGIDIIKDVSFKIHSGEIFGVAGVAGNGQAELAEVIAGIRPISRGQIFLGTEEITHSTPKARREKKIAHIPEERYKNGVFIDLPIYLNLILGREDKQPFSRNGLLRYNQIFKFSKEVTESYDVKMSGINMLVRYMSGGNMQKLLLAREFAGEPELIIASQPTRGLDIKTTDFVRSKLLEASENGKSVLLISYDLDEIMLLADRIGVMFEGRMSIVDPKNCERKKVEEMMVSSGSEVH
jgi:simple sugar transport system ATP-binding protein